MQQDILVRWHKSTLYIKRKEEAIYVTSQIIRHWQKNTSITDAVLWLVLAMNLTPLAHTYNDNLCPPFHCYNLFIIYSYLNIKF